MFLRANPRRGRDPAFFRWPRRVPVAANARNEIGSRSISASSRNARGETGVVWPCSPEEPRGAFLFLPSERRIEQIRAAARARARVVPDIRRRLVDRPPWMHERAFVTGVWSAPKCADTLVACETWAKAGECAKNPGFMIKARRRAAACVRSCCGKRRRRRRAGEPLGVADGVLRVVRGHELAAAVRGDARERGLGHRGARRGGCDCIRPPGRRWRCPKLSVLGLGLDFW